MDQTHSRAIEALQPFIHLANANSATSPRFVAQIITNATSSPQTYVFAELLETPTIQSLRSSHTPAEYQSYLKLLEIFAWGTWQDYQGTSPPKQGPTYPSAPRNLQTNYFANPTSTATPNLPKLSAEQAQKLRILSLLSLASKVKPLTYNALIDALSLSSSAELESLVTSAIYASLISARLSPATSPPTVNVLSVAPLRDVSLQSLPTMVSQLTEWEAQCGKVVSDIEAEVASIRANAEKRVAKQLVHDVLLDEASKRRQDATATYALEGLNGNAAPRRRGLRYGSGIGSNKREADVIDQDDGFWEAGEGGDPAGSRMDIDEGAGSARGGSRHSKRVVGRKT